MARLHEPLVEYLHTVLVCIGQCGQHPVQAQAAATAITGCGQWVSQLHREVLTSLSDMAAMVD